MRIFLELPPTAFFLGEHLHIQIAQRFAKREGEAVNVAIARTEVGQSVVFVELDRDRVLGQLIGRVIAIAA